MKNLLLSLFLLCVLGLGGCGGGGGDSVAVPVQAAAQADVSGATNALPVVVDRGPAIFARTGRKVVNTLYATVTICTPGSATQCETIDHVIVDTGSVGLRILAAATNGTAAMKPLADPASGAPLRQCEQFVDGYTWGSVVTADVKLAGYTLASLPVNLMGDPNAGQAAPSCVSGPAENDIAALGGNGVLGIGVFRHDCGPSCVTAAVKGRYYTCPNGGSGALCKPTAVPLDHQLPNPVAALPADNNGVTISLPAVPPSGSAKIEGVVYFGVDTQDNNAMSGAQTFTMDSSGTLLTRYDGSDRRSLFDTGAGGNYFNNDSLPMCAKNKGLYCPTAAGQPSSAPQTAEIIGYNGPDGPTVRFTVDNMDDLFGDQSALPGVAGPSGPTDAMGGWFFWGLPFFYGRTVHLLFEDPGEPVRGPWNSYPSNKVPTLPAIAF